MHLQRIILSSIIVLTILAVSITCDAQNVSWLKKSWPGRAYILGSSPKNYNLILAIKTIKGKNFEGILTTIQPTDTSIHFDTKITGVIFEKTLQINIGPWKVNCGNCKPQILNFVIESGKFFLKGEARGCSEECTWITEFGKELIDFNVTENEALFAMADEIIAPEPDKEPVAENTNPPIDTVAVAVAAVVAPPVKEIIPEPKRIPILPAGNTVTVKNKTAIVIPKKNPGSITKNASVKIKENAPVAPQRIPVLPAGDIVVKNKTVAVFPPKLSVALNKKASLKVKENAPVEKRIAILPAGDIVVKNKQVAAFPPKLSVALNNRASLKIKENTPVEKRIAILPAGNIVVKNKQVAAFPPKLSVALNKKASLKIKENAPVEKRITILPAGDVVVKNKTAAPVIKKPGLLPVKNAPLAIKENEPRITKAIIPTIDTITQTVKNTPPPVTPKIIPPPPPTVSLLPKDYGERKINVVRTLTVNTDSITLRVYDNGVVDGDIVSVVYNDKIVIDKLSLKSKAMVIKIAVKDRSINKLVFYAHNLGEFPPNTALLEIQYGSKTEQLTIASDYTVSSAIDIVYKE